jgi:hypothetical protein
MQHPDGMRSCPTRTDGETSLIASQITVAQCQKHQREHFHKCPTCVHYNPRGANVPSLDLAVAVAASAEPPPRPA